MIGSTCVVCLKHTRLAESLFQHNEDLTYADMIAFVANIEIVESKSDKAMICLICQRKLKELYDFKVLIRRSYSELNAIKHRRLVFDNIDEFKFLLKPIKDKAKQNLKHLLLDNKNFFTHYETAITRIYNEKPITVTDVPESIIEKYEHDDVDDEDDNDEISDFYNLDDSYPEYQKDHNNKNIGVKKFKCENEKCNKRFFTRGHLNAHIKIHFPNPDAAYKCDHCTAVFTQQTRLVSHMSTHTDNRPHICDICQRNFKRPSTLTRHKLIHTIPMCKCEVCGIGFRTKSALRHHQRVHTGERPFNCKICSQPYSYKRDFNMHCLKKHGVFLKHRDIYVMDEETMQRERALMKDLLFKVESGLKINEITNPFKGPHAAIAFEMAMKFLKENKMPIDYF